MPSGIIGIAEVVTFFRIVDEFGLIRFRRMHQRTARAPPAHELGSHFFLIVFAVGAVGALGSLREETPKGGDVLIDLSVNDECAVERQFARFRCRRFAIGLILVAEQEFAGLDRLPMSHRVGVCRNQAAVDRSLPCLRSVRR